MVRLTKVNHLIISGRWDKVGFLILRIVPNNIINIIDTLILQLSICGRSSYQYFPDKFDRTLKQLQLTIAKMN